MNVADQLIPAFVMMEAFCLSVGVLAQVLWFWRRWVNRHDDEREDWIEDIENAWERRTNRGFLPINIPGWSLEFVGGHGWCFRSRRADGGAIFLDR